jgi:hypothetical protein
MNRLLAGVVLALVLSAPVSAASGASITAPDGLSFTDAYTVTYIAPNHFSASLWAHATCSQSGSQVYAIFVELDESVPGGTVDMDNLGPTPSWMSGGADCSVELIAISGLRQDKIYATDTFSVGP